MQRDAERERESLFESQEQLALRPHLSIAQQVGLHTARPGMVKSQLSPMEPSFRKQTFRQLEAPLRQT